jgi:hypothetical protein
MAWAAGLGKLGGVGEGILGAGGKERGGESGEGKMRVVRPKGVVVELPRTAKDLGERIDLPGRGWSYMREFYSTVASDIRVTLGLNVDVQNDDAPSRKGGAGRASRRGDGAL